MAHTAPKSQATTNHIRLTKWVDEVAALTQPDDVYWCDGSDDEYEQLAEKLVEAGDVRAAVRRLAPELLSRAVRPR